MPSLTGANNQTKVMSSPTKKHELEKCADVLANVNKNLRLASSHLDVMIGTMTETNKIADTWVNLWRKMQDTNVEKASNIDNEEAEKHVNKNNDGKTKKNIGKRKKNQRIVNNNNSRSFSSSSSSRHQVKSKRFKNK